MGFDALVLRAGDQVTATGLLIRNDRGDWLQPSLPLGGPGRGERRVRSVWRGAVRITGADFAALANRFEQDGAVEGAATVTGVWSGEQLRVDRQTPPPPRSAWVNPWITPPCPPPPGGWPQVTRRGDILLDYDIGDLSDTGAAVAVTLFQPGTGQAVLVVAASDQAAVEARLRPQRTAKRTSPSAWHGCCRRSPPGPTRFRMGSWLLTPGCEFGRFVDLRSAVPAIRRRRAVPKEEVLAIFATAPVIDVDELRADLDEAVGQELRDPYEGTGL
jgi:hypothetical protein